MKELDRFYNVRRLKKLDMNEVMKALGGKEHPASRDHHKSRAWNYGEAKVVITKNIFFNNATQVGGANPINLVMELMGLSFYDACEILALLPFIGAFEEVEPTSKASREYDAAKDKENAYWPLARDYLISKRCLDARLVDLLYEKGALFADVRANCCFRVLGGAGVLKRGSVDPDPPKRAFKQKIGMGFFVLEGESEECFVVESPIDALSVKMLNPGAWAVATGGNCNLDALRWLLIGKKIFVATDVDEAGERLANKLIARFGGTRFIPPLGKDWNEYIQHLQAGKRGDDDEA